MSVTSTSCSDVSQLHNTDTPSANPGFASGCEVLFGEEVFVLLPIDTEFYGIAQATVYNAG